MQLLLRPVNDISSNTKNTSRTMEWRRRLRASIHAKTTCTHHPFHPVLSPALPPKQPKQRPNLAESAPRSLAKTSQQPGEFTPQTVDQTTLSRSKHEQLFGSNRSVNLPGAITPSRPYLRFCLPVKHLCLPAVAVMSSIIAARAHSWDCQCCCHEHTIPHVDTSVIMNCHLAMHCTAVMSAFVSCVCRLCDLSNPPSTLNTLPAGHAATPFQPPLLTPDPPLPPPRFSMCSPSLLNHIKDLTLGITAELCHSCRSAVSDASPHATLIPQTKESH